MCLPILIYVFELFSAFVELLAPYFNSSSFSLSLSFSLVHSCSLTQYFVCCFSMVFNCTRGNFDDDDVLINLQLLQYFRAKLFVICICRVLRLENSTLEKLPFNAVTDTLMLNIEKLLDLFIRWKSKAYFINPYWTPATVQIQFAIK